MNSRAADLFPYKNAKTIKPTMRSTPKVVPIPIPAFVPVERLLVWGESVSVDAEGGIIVVDVCSEVGDGESLAIDVDCEEVWACRCRIFSPRKSLHLWKEEYIQQRVPKAQN
jgi:hypothetical protein